MEAQPPGTGAWDDVFKPARVADAGSVLITETGQALGLADLRRRRAGWRQALAGAGLTPSHRLAMLLPNTGETAAAILSLVDAVNLMPLNPQANPASLAAQIAEAGADAVIVASGAAGDALAAALGDSAPAVLRWTGSGAPVDLHGRAAGAPCTPRTPGLVLLTSGSTGAPKRVPLSPEQLLASARNIAASLALGPGDRAVHALPMFHVGAVVDLLLAPLIAGGSVVVARGLAADEIARAVIEHRATWLQLVPAALAHLVETAAPETGQAMGARLRFVRMVSADLPEPLRAAGEAFLHGTPLIQMYGMTETAGQIATMALPPAPRVAHSVGRVAGPEVALIDGHAALVAVGQVGEICVRGPTVMKGYEGDARTPRHGDWLRTGDLGRCDSAGHLFITGRVKEMINRGGEKISPVPIERAAKAIDEVTDAVAFALPHPTLGEQVGLAVAGPRGLDEAALRAALAAQLSEFEMPRRLLRLDTLPKLANGKTDRRAVARLGRGEGAAQAPELNPLARKVAKVWAATLKCRPPHVEADFFEDGGDSLSATDFLLALEQALGRAMPPNLLFEAPRFGALVQALDAGGTQTPVAGGAQSTDEPPYFDYLRKRTAGWRGQRAGRHGLIVARNTVKPGTKVFFADNGIKAATLVGRHFAADHPFYILRTLRDYSRGFRALIAELAGHYADEIEALLAPGEPVILGGFCGGANLMEAVAPLLIARGHAVALFVALDKLFHAPTPYPVLYIGTDSPLYSPTGRYLDATRGHADLHPEGAEVLHLDGVHVQAIRAATFARVADRAAAILAGAALPKPPRPARAEAIGFAARRARYRAKIRGRVPLFVPRGGSVPVPVRVTNTSAVAWPPSAQSGLFLSAGMVSLFGRHLVDKLDVARFDRVIAPGDSFTATLRLAWPFPDRDRPHLLTLRMVDDGYDWFDSVEKSALRRLVLPR